MAELSPSQYAQLRDSVCEAVTSHLSSVLADALAKQEAVTADLIASQMETLVELVRALQLKQDDIEGRFAKLEKADRYILTRRALVKLLEQTNDD